MRNIKAPVAVRLPSGSWRCRVRISELGVDESITGENRKQVEREALAVKMGYIEKAKQPMKLCDAYARYIDLKDGILSPSTIAGYKRLSHNTMQGIMQLRLQDLDNQKIQAEIKRMVLAGKSPKYISNAQGLLSAVLREYHPKFELHTTLPQKRRVEQRAVSDEEIQKIIAAVSGSEIELPVLMALWLGMRMSEVIGAEYKDIKHGRLHIQRAVVTDYDGNAVEKPPKTFSGNRYVNIPPHIMQLIDATGRTEGKIVTLSSQAIYKRFCIALEQNGIEHCRFHDLRHANAAVMIRLGIDSKYAQERNGWTSDKMYKDTYGYVMQDAMQTVDQTINEYFTSKLPQPEKKPPKRFHIVRSPSEFPNK